MTEKEVRRIAKEEALKVGNEILKEIEEIKVISVESKQTLARIQRMLEGEIGTDEEDTLKGRALFSYKYCKYSTDMKIIERAIPALYWFHDMNTPEKGCIESKLDTLGKIITAWSSLKWGFRTIGIINLATLIAVIILLKDFIN